VKYHVIDERGQNVGAVYVLDDADPEAIISALDDDGLLDDYDEDAEFGVAEFAPNDDRAAPRGFEVLDENDDLLLELYPDGYEPADDVPDGEDDERDDADDYLGGATIDGECREIH
jgi:hypothetical protein